MQVVGYSVGTNWEQNNHIKKSIDMVGDGIILGLCANIIVPNIPLDTYAGLLSIGVNGRIIREEIPIYANAVKDYHKRIDLGDFDFSTTDFLEIVYKDDALFELLKTKTDDERNYELLIATLYE